jgi:hypothetical protein
MMFGELQLRRSSDRIGLPVESWTAAIKMQNKAWNQMPDMPQSSRGGRFLSVIMAALVHFDVATKKSDPNTPARATPFTHFPTLIVATLLCCKIAQGAVVMGTVPVALDSIHGPH